MDTSSQTFSALAAGAALALALAACGDASLDTPSPARPDPTGRVDTQADGAAFVTTVDATDDEAWVYVSLAAGGVEAEERGAWDLAFRRSNLRLNGGAGGSGQGAAQPLAGVSFSETETAPRAGWLEDRESEEMTPDGSPVNNDGLDLVFARENSVSPSGWFHYDPSTHVLTPADLVWAVRGADGATYAVRIVDWYDMAGTSAVWTLRWKTISPEAAPNTPGLEVDARDPMAWVHLSVSSGAVVTVANPATSTDWDLALSRTRLRTSSGVSGPGMGGSRAFPSGARFETLAESPTSGFVTDAELPNPGPPGSGTSPGNPVLAEWYDYDPSTHAVSPKDTAYLLRTADGGYAKLRILAWEDGVFRIDVASLPPRADVFEIEVDASERAIPAFVSLREGRAITATTADTTWDLAFTRTRIQTSSGVSGPGRGGALELEGDRLDGLGMLPETGYRADELIDSGRPGVPPSAANPALASWFDYDPATHSVSPRPTIFAVRTADGHLAAIRILSYDDGVFRVRGIFAGPGRSTLP